MVVCEHMAVDVVTGTATTEVSNVQNRGAYTVSASPLNADHVVQPFLILPGSFCAIAVYICISTVDSP